jgi:hypothetical protein
MPRPERPIDASAGPLQEFAAALRKLRTEAGGPPYRTMAANAHVSKASLSAAAAGHRLPTWEVVRAYVAACGGDVDEWRERWMALRAELGHPATHPAAGRPATHPTAGRPAALPAAEPAGQTPRRRRRSVLIAAGALALVAVAMGAGAVWYTGEPTGTPEPVPPVPSQPSGTAARFVGGSEPLADNADPKKTGCADDPTQVTTLDAVQVHTLNQNLLGVAQLRHSVPCGASWGRFEPSDRMTYLPGAFTVTITAHRPATGTVGTSFTAEFDGQAVYGNILLDAAGCVEITVEIRSPHGDGAATTACRR